MAVIVDNVRRDNLKFDDSVFIVNMIYHVSNVCITHCVSVLQLCSHTVFVPFVITDSLGFTRCYAFLTKCHKNLPDCILV